MISADSSTTFEEDETSKNLKIIPMSLQILQQVLKSNYNNFTKSSSDFLSRDLKTILEYEYHLRRIEELLVQLQHETSDHEKCNLSFPSLKNESRASPSQNLSRIEIPFSELKSSSFGKEKLNESKTFSNIKSSNSEILHSSDSSFNFPCRITSCICGKKSEKQSSQESKISKIFSAFNLKEHIISKSFLNKDNFNKFSHSEIFNETNLENTIFPCKCVENLYKTPINIQLSMDAAGDSNSPLTFVVEVPSSVLEVLQKRSSNINNSESLSTVKKSRSPRPKRRCRLKSAFSKLLRNKATKSFTSTSTLKSSSSVNSEISSSELEIGETPVKDINPCNSFPVLSEFSQIHFAHRTSDVLKTDVCNSDVEKISTDGIIEKQLTDNKSRNEKSDSKERKLTLDELYANFLETQFKKERDNKLKSESENTSLYCLKCERNLEYPIDVKIRGYPLMLKRSHHRDKNKTNLQKEELLEMAGDLQEKPLDKNLVQNEGKFGSKATFLSGDKSSSVLKTSTLESLLQNLTDVRDNKNINLVQPAEKDWHQTLSTRQLSQISLCSSGNCSCSIKDEYDSGVIEITEEDKNEKNDIKLSMTARLHRLTLNVFGR